MSLANQGLASRIMVGVPSSYLSPRLPFPPNPDYNVSVGIELAPGLGVSLDGKALLVGPDSPEGKTEIIGHLEDGTYPQRDTLVLRNDDETVVDGYYDWQDYALKGEKGGFIAAGDSRPKSFEVRTLDNGDLRVRNPFAARAWTIRQTPDGISVRSDYLDGESFVISGDENSLLVDSNFEDQDFRVDFRGQEATIDGHLNPEDFEFKKTEYGFELTGHYPQQRFQIISPSA